jgi:hypothetical protein
MKIEIKRVKGLSFGGWCMVLDLFIQKSYFINLGLFKNTKNE